MTTSALDQARQSAGYRGNRRLASDKQVARAYIALHTLTVALVEALKYEIGSEDWADFEAEHPEIETLGIE